MERPSLYTVNPTPPEPVARQGPLILLDTGPEPGDETWVDTTRVAYVIQSSPRTVTISFGQDTLHVIGTVRSLAHLIHAAQLEWCREVAYEQEVGRLMALDAEGASPPGEAEPNP
jgi:hypothetical protein